MLTPKTATLNDPIAGAETHARGDAYAHAVLDDEGCPPPPCEEPASMTFAARSRELFTNLSYSLRSNPVATMAIALGAGYVIGRLRARS